MAGPVDEHGQEAARDPLHGTASPAWARCRAGIGMRVRHHGATVAPHAELLCIAGTSSSVGMEIRDSKTIAGYHILYGHTTIFCWFRDARRDRAGAAAPGSPARDR